MLSLNRWQRSYKRLKPHSEFGICCRTYRILCKLGTIVMNNPHEDTKSMDDMVFNKVNHIGSFDFNKWYIICPL